MAEKYRVKEGDGTTKIAFNRGLFPDTIWNHPENAKLKSLRDHPDILKTGDVVFIPDKREKKVERQTGKKHKFRRKGVPAITVIQFFVADVPRSNQKYKLVVNGKTIKGTTDEDGRLKEYVPPDIEKADLTFEEDGQKYELRFGTLDPISETKGLQTRLKNLGYDCGKIDGSVGEKTRAALTRFQNRFGLEETGKIDEITSKKLAEFHDKTGKLPTPGEAESEERQ